MRRRRFTTIPFFLLISILITTVGAAGTEPATGIDENGDGKTDQWIEPIEEDKTRIRKDRNFDGTVDYELIIDEYARKESETLDYNYDGEMDDFYFYRNGVLIRQEIDTNYDGKIDLWVHLKEGVYIRKVERDRDFDGEVDYVKDYEDEDNGDE